MEGSKTEFVNKTILNTPKPTASSTVNKKNAQRKVRVDNIDSDESLGILNVSNISNVSREQNRSIPTADLSYELQQQRVLANSSLQRANKVAGIPSRYLRPNTRNSTSNINTTNEIIFNESDLSNTSLKNTSTPRESAASYNSALKDVSRLSLGQSMAQLSYQISNSDISIDNFVKEFQKAMNSSNKTTEIDSQMFSPAEEAASLLRADELSWRRKNEMPISNNFSQIANDDVSYGKVSVGEFFQQKSDSLSEFKLAVSPVKSKNPIPLIDPSFVEEQKNEKGRESNKSLSISAIKKLLAETDDTPRKVTSFLLKQGQKVSECASDRLSLPCSKNSSYTSNYSDNEAMRALVSNKENIDTYNIPQKDTKSPNRPSSTDSARSVSSALTSLPNGKLPIESTKAELIWGCVKVDKCLTRDFLLRNKTPKRLCLQMSVSGYDFKIRKDNRQESEPLSSAKILLNPHESKSIIVSFIPTKIGAAIDELSFTSLDPSLQQTKKQCVRLFGYGGYGKINILNLTKDITGKFWLSLGKMTNHNILTHSFIIKNTGTLPSFTYIAFKPKELFAFANVSVKPNFTVLIPNEQKEITITFTMTMEDHEVLQRSMFSNTLVAEIGNLAVLSGTEADRGRLRRQCRKCAEKGLDVDPVSNILKDKIQGEVMPADIHLFKESPGSLREFLKLFSRSEVIVTIEQDPELTIMPQYPDDSEMFQSLCQDNTMIQLKTTMQSTCKLEPLSIILTPPTKIKDSLFLISESKTNVHFEVVSEPEGLLFSPKDGMTVPGRETIITVTYPKVSSDEKKIFKVLVYVDNCVLETAVKIAFIYGQCS